MSLIPRRLLYWVLGVVVAGAILVAVAEAALVFGAVGPVIAAALGAGLLPILWHGASTGALRPAVAWTAAVIGCIICLVATIGLDAMRVDCVSVAWYPCGLLAGSVMVWMAGQRLPATVAIGFMVAQMLAWAGPLGVVRLGVASEVVLVVAGLLMHRALLRVTTAARAAAAQHRELTIWRADQEAYHLERETRLHRAGRNAAPMLQRIIDLEGELDELARAECRLLEQTLRDEIRGRRLLNDAVRDAVLAHRRRGSLVQVLDDGGLDEVPPRELAPLLDELALRLEPLRSSRIVIRTSRGDSGTAITVVATTPDETAAALGLVDDEQVDLWAAIPFPRGALVAR